MGEDKKQQKDHSVDEQNDQEQSDEQEQEQSSSYDDKNDNENGDDVLQIKDMFGIRNMKYTNILARGKTTNGHYTDY